MAGTGILKRAGLAICMALATTTLAVAACADNAAQTAPAPYLLAGDDVISITVVNFTNLSVPSVVVPPDGKIAVPLLDTVDVMGKTTAEVAKALTERWRRYVVNPSVSVGLVQKRKDNILVYGWVVRPGTIDYRPNTKVLEALATAGGALPAGDLAAAVVTHRTGVRQTLDLSHPEHKGGTKEDITLEIGDVLYIPERHTEISVVGEVKTPGSFEYKDEMRVLDALTVAGGVNPDTADYYAATLIHDGKETKLDLDAMLRHGDMAGNVKLSAGDRIMVPETINRTYVFGAVNKPGYYAFKQKDRIVDALNGCGGTLPNAQLDKVNVIRIDKTKTKAVVQVVNVDKFLKKGDMQPNIELGPGDVLYIPFKKKPLGIDTIAQALTTLNFLDMGARIFNGNLGTRY